MELTLLLFVVVYVAMGLGHLPGSRVDRTGAALIGGIAMIVAGKIAPQAAWDAIDYRTIGMLFGLMVVSAAFVVSGFYAWTAERVASLDVSPPALLAILVVVAGLLSSLLTNDVVVVAMTPLLVEISLARGLNPIPFLLAFCFASNTGASGTIIGSPQNMIAAQGLGLSFTGFLKAAGLPALLSLPIVWGIVALLYRKAWHLASPPQGKSAASVPVPVNVWETGKAVIVTLCVVGAFVLTDWPRDLIALAGASFLLINRKIASADVMKHVDGNLLLMLMGLFVVNAALAHTGMPQQLLGVLRDHGFDLHNPLWLFAVTSVLSDIVGNNPTVMLLVPYLGEGAANANALGAALALGTGFSSNLILFGSLAGIIVVEEAAARGVKISFGEFARAGVPVALACVALAVMWLLVIG